MKHYNFKEIREKGSCIAFAEQFLGAKVVNDRCVAVWRDGDRSSVSIAEDKWFDHGIQQGGGILELCALTKFGSVEFTAIQQAQEVLGDWLHLDEVQLRKAPACNRYETLISEGYTEVARYNYIDLDGVLSYFVVRMEHATLKKEFLQGTPTHWGLGDVTPIPYNWIAINSSEWCVIVEGEKDVETLRAIGVPATTNSGGAKKWKAEFSEYFRGKNIIILPDNDEVGQEHARMIANDLHSVASGVKVVTCSKLPKGDVTDYFTKENGSWELLSSVIKETAPFTPDESLSVFEIAKNANKLPFRNYTIEEREVGKRVIKDKIPRQINELVADLHRRLLGAPFKVGEQLFDQDKESGKVSYIFDQSGLFSWIARKTGCTVEWARIDGCVTKGEFYEALRSEAKEFSGISYVPDFPKRKDIFYSHPPLPPPSENHKIYYGFLNFFNPDGEVNRSLLSAFVMAPIFYRTMVNRPMWIIDSPNGQGSGKSKVPEMVAFLYGNEYNSGEVIDITMEELTYNYQEIIKRIISTKGRNARILRIDNVEGILKSGKLAMMVTTGSISGRASYGRDEETRPNNLTYVATVNGATVDTDIASRSYYIMVKKPVMSPTWEDDIISYISKYRMQIFADIIDIISKHTVYDIPPVTRMPRFETTILQAACGSPEQYQCVVDFILDKKEETNMDEDLAKLIVEEIETQLRNVKIPHGSTILNGRSEKIFIRAEVLNEWFSGRNWMSNKYPTGMIQGMGKTGMLPQVSPKIKKYPHNQDEKINRRTGVMWNYELNSEPRIIGIKGREISEIIDER